MKETSTQIAEETSIAPVGFIKPTGERAIRALKALADKRLSDAEDNIAAMDDTSIRDRAWKCHLRGLALIERRKLADAESSFAQAASYALAAAWSGTRDPGADDMRLGAASLESIGLVQRRSDQPDDAYAIHEAAYRIRVKYGSIEERFESAASCGLDADLARRFDDAERWHKVAIDHATAATEESAGKQAQAWTHLATVLINASRYDEAVSAARTACGLWRDHDITAASVALAEIRLGNVLVKCAEECFYTNASCAEKHLQEAVGLLEGAEKSLRAFGSAFDVDVDLCDQKVNFAQRLIESVGV